jgi:hypothetical protein
VSVQVSRCLLSLKRSLRLSVERARFARFRGGITSGVTGVEGRRLGGIMVWYATVLDASTGEAGLKYTRAMTRATTS